MLRYVILFLAGWWLLTVLDRPEDEWAAYVYGDRNDLTVHEAAGTYPSLEACRSASMGRLGVISPNGGGDYECGLNCRPRSDLGGMNVCEETSR